MARWIRWKFSDPIPVRLEFVRGERERELEKEIEDLRDLLKKQKEAFDRLERNYGYETVVNAELIDLLRENRIPFRPALEAAKRKW